jgi:hypothetical protein
MATVAVDALNLRAAAGKSSALRQTLKAGTRLFVVGEPLLADGLRWHHVAVIDPSPCVWCVETGWVATPSSGTDAWIKEVAITCPGPPVEAEQLAALLPLEQLHCYGNRELTVTGWIDTPCCSGEGPLILSPWLAGEAWGFFRPRSGDGRLVQVHFDPDSRLELPTTTVIIRATAHFDDPASTTCRASVADFAVGEFDERSLPAMDALVLSCRSSLVISAYEVVGYLPGPECGCLPPSPEPAA